MQEIYLKIRHFGRELSNKLKKVTLIFTVKYSRFNGVNYQKQKEPRTSDNSLFRLQNKYRKMSLFYINRPSLTM